MYETEARTPLLKHFGSASRLKPAYEAHVHQLLGVFNQAGPKGAIRRAGTRSASVVHRNVTKRSAPCYFTKYAHKGVAHLC